MSYKHNYRHYRYRRYRWWLREEIAKIDAARRDGLLTTREAARFMRAEGAPLPVAMRLLAGRASA